MNNYQDAEKNKILLTLLTENTNELRFWRERNWKFTCWIISSILVLSGVSIFSGESRILIPLYFILGLISTIYLIKVYFRNYRGLKNHRINIEEALGFYNQGTYIPDKQLFDSRKQKSSFTKGSLIFIIIIWIVVLASCYCISKIPESAIR